MIANKCDIGDPTCAQVEKEHTDNNEEPQDDYGDDDQEREVEVTDEEIIAFEK